MEVRDDEDAEYTIENRYLMLHVIKSSIPHGVLLQVYDYFDKTFKANPWIQFDSALPRQYAVEIFLAWVCDYNEENEYGMSPNNSQITSVSFNFTTPSPKTQ